MAQLVKHRLQWGRSGFDPWLGKIPWRRERLPTPVWGLSGTRLTERLSPSSFSSSPFPFPVSLSPISVFRGKSNRQPSSLYIFTIHTDVNVMFLLSCCLVETWVQGPFTMNLLLLLLLLWVNKDLIFHSDSLSGWLVQLHKKSHTHPGP